MSSLTNSGGLAYADAEWLDLFVSVYAREHRQMVRSLALRPGASVLDAGCGGGSTLGLLAEAVGPDGSVTGIDLVEGSVEHAKKKLPGLGCRSSVQTADVRALPFPERSFDGVWVGDVIEYIADEELDACLKGLKRILRPGATIALRETDPWLGRVSPSDPIHYIHWVEAARRAVPFMGRLAGATRGRGPLRRWFERAGFTDVRQEVILAERWAPLTDDERNLFVATHEAHGRLAQKMGLAGADLEFFVGKPPIDDPAFYRAWGFVLVTGRAP